LGLREFHLDAQALEHPYRRFANRRVEGVDDAGDEQLDFGYRGGRHGDIIAMITKTRP
jgi:hypothetical protein